MSTKSNTTYNAGDLVKVQGETGVWYAEIVGEDEEQQLEVFYINRSENHWVWKYDEDWETVSKECILEHIPLVSCSAVLRMCSAHTPCRVRLLRATLWAQV